MLEQAMLEKQKGERAAELRALEEEKAELNKEDEAKFPKEEK